jgi:hypothetical protein
MSDKPKPHPKNVAGDFYVEDGCCTACLVPEVYAPNLMGYDESDAHCFVAKQPTNEDEVYEALKMTWGAELECIRYKGEDPHILKRLAEVGAADSCDHKHLIQGIKPLFRNHITFHYPQIKSELELADQFKDHILSQNSKYLRYQVTGTKTDKSGVTFSFSWDGDNYYSIWFNQTKLDVWDIFNRTGLDAWHIFHSPDYEQIGSKSISLTIDEWLRSKNEISDIKWHTNKAWDKALVEWQKTPF